MPGTTSRGYTMLMIRVEEGDFDGVKGALQKYPNEKINDQNKHGQTALALAARTGNCDIGEYLILEGADVNLPNKSGQTPLFIACSYNHLDFVKLLLRHKAEINVSDSRGWTPLMSACQNSNVPLVELLLKYKADVRPIDRFGKTARQRTKDARITSILLEIEKRIDQLEESNFVTPNKKKSVRSISQESPSKTSLGHSLAHLDKEGDEEGEDRDSIIDMYSSNLDQTLRACPQFVSDMEIYKMHKKAGYYNYLKSTDPRNLRTASLQNLKKDRRDKSLEYLLDLNSTLKSPMTMTDLLTDRSRGRRNTLKDLKDTPERGSSSFKTAKKGKRDAKEEGEALTPKSSGRTHSTPLLGKTVEDQKIDSSLLKSMVSPAGTAKPKYKSILKNSARLEEFSSPQTLNITQQDQAEENDDEVLNGELRNLYKTFIEKLAERTQKIMNDKVAKAIDQETEQNKSITKEKMDEIINNIGAELEDKTIVSFKALVAELMDNFPLIDKLSGVVAEGTEQLINRVTLYAQEDISKLNHELNSPKPHRKPDDIVQDNENTSVDKLKATISDKVDELFKALDDALSGNSDSEKEDFIKKFTPEILETLEKLKQRILNGEEEEAEEDIEEVNNKKSPSELGLKKFLEIPGQNQATSEISGNMRYSEVQNSSDSDETPQAAVPRMTKKDSQSSNRDNSIEMEMKNNSKPHERESVNELGLENLSTQRSTDQNSNTLGTVQENNGPISLRSHRAHSLENDSNSDVSSPQQAVEGVSLKSINAKDLESDNDVSIEGKSADKIAKGANLKAHNAQRLESDNSEGLTPIDKESNNAEVGVNILRAQELESDANTVSETESPKEVSKSTNLQAGVNAQKLESDIDSSVASPSKVEGNTRVNVNTHNAHELESDKKTDSHASSPCSETKGNLNVNSVKLNAQDLESDKSGSSKASSPQEPKQAIIIELNKTSVYHANKLESDQDTPNSNFTYPTFTKENVDAETNEKNQNIQGVEAGSESLKKQTNVHNACELESDKDTNSVADASSPAKTPQVNVSMKLSIQKQNAHELESDKDSNSEIQSAKEEAQRHKEEEESQSQSDDLVLFGKSQKTNTREFNNDHDNSSRKFTETEEREEEHEHDHTGDDISGRKGFVHRCETIASEVMYDDHSQRVFEQSGVIIGRKKEILKDDSLADIDMVESEMVSNFDGLTERGTPVVRDGGVAGRRILDKLNTLDSEVLYRCDSENTQIQIQVKKEENDEIKEEDVIEEVLKSNISGGKIGGSVTKEDVTPVRSNAKVDSETMRKTLLRRHVVSQNITSFTSRARPMIPVPTPSRFVTKTVRMQINEIPRCENFHYLGQSKRLRGRSLEVPRKIWRETRVGMEEITIIEH